MHEYWSFWRSLAEDLAIFFGLTLRQGSLDPDISKKPIASIFRAQQVLNFQFLLTF
jgi:hypothetical protein